METTETEAEVVALREVVGSVEEAAAVRMVDEEVVRAAGRVAVGRVEDSTAVAERSGSPTSKNGSPPTRARVRARAKVTATVRAV